MTPRASVLLDRDGVIVEDVGYLADPERLAFIAGAPQAIARLNAAGLPVAVVTNQAGIARGYLTEARLHEIHARLDALLAEHGARVDRYYYCPHHPTAGRGEYRVACECRKPRPGMLLAAARDLQIDLARSFFVGDKRSDLEAGAAAGCRTLLVRTGYGAQTEATLDAAAVRLARVSDTLGEAVDWCLAELARGG